MHSIKRGVVDISSRQRQTGFTLAEAMVVLAVVAVLSGMAAPSFIGLTQKIRVSAEASSLMGSLTLARSEALKRGIPVTLCTSSDGVTCLGTSGWHTGWIMFPDPDANKTVDVLIKQQPTMTSGDTIAAGSATSSVTFNRDGFAIYLPAASVTFTIHSTPINDNATRCIEVTKTGRLATQTFGIGACT